MCSHAHCFKHECQGDNTCCLQLGRLDAKDALDSGQIVQQHDLERCIVEPKGAQRHVERQQLHPVGDAHDDSNQHRATSSDELRCRDFQVQRMHPLAARMAGKSSRNGKQQIHA